MLELRRELATELRRRRVRIEVPDENTVVFRSVPTNASFFNKRRTNLLINRADAETPFLVFVDGDLVYRGSDPELAKVFAAGPGQQGWRVLLLGDAPDPDFQLAVDRGLAAVGFRGETPRMLRLGHGEGASGEAGILTTLGVDISRQVEHDGVEPTTGRQTEVEAVASCLLRHGQSRLALVVGESGIGKSNLLMAVARFLKQVRAELALVSLDMSEVLAGALFDAYREKLLFALLRQVLEEKDTVLVAERLECAIREVPHGPLLLAHALDGGLRLAGTILPQYVSLFYKPPLARRVQTVTLREPDLRETLAILDAARERIATHHSVTIDEALLPLCVKAACPLPGCLPGKALTVLDEAASNAAIVGTRTLTPDDICGAASRCAAFRSGSGEMT